MKERKPKTIHEFDVKYRKKYGIKTDEDLFYNAKISSYFILPLPLLRSAGSLLLFTCC